MATYTSNQKSVNKKRKGINKFPTSESTFAVAKVVAGVGELDFSGISEGATTNLGVLMRYYMRNYFHPTSRDSKVYDPSTDDLMGIELFDTLNGEFNTSAHTFVNGTYDEWLDFSLCGRRVHDASVLVVTEGAGYADFTFPSPHGIPTDFEPNPNANWGTYFLLGTDSYLATGNVNSKDYLTFDSVVDEYTIRSTSIQTQAAWQAILDGISTVDTIHIYYSDVLVRNNQQQDFSNHQLILTFKIMVDFDDPTTIESVFSDG